MMNVGDDYADGQMNDRQRESESKSKYLPHTWEDMIFFSIFFYYIYFKEDYKGE